MASAVASEIMYLVIYSAVMLHVQQYPKLYCVYL
jgi:hypothetical protein